MRESSDEDDASGSEVEDEEVFTMYRDTLLTKGIKTQSKNAHQVAKLQANNSEEVGQNQDLTLPPIDARRTGPRRKGDAVKAAGQRVAAKKNSTNNSTVGSGLGVPRHLMVAQEASNSRGESRKKGLRTAA